jgi:cell division control protein 6
MTNLDEIFNSVEDRSLFKNKKILQDNYTPEDIPHREDEINQVARILAPCLRGERTSNLFIYGKTGTGKTLSVQRVINEILRRSRDSRILDAVYLNCKMKSVADTEYRIFAELIKSLGGDIPATGLPTKEVYRRFVEIIEEKEEKLFIITLDEIDQAIKKISDDFLYSLTRLNSELNNTEIILIGISNDLRFLENIDQRVKSSLSEEELVFHPYNAIQLKDILRKRADAAFKPKVVDDGVIGKCAAYAAREHGDARRALTLLRVAGELAERSSKSRIEMEHIDQANDKIEKDKILDIIEKATKQFQLVLLSIIELLSRNNDSIFTGDVYSYYQDLCKRVNVEVLTQRRVSDIIAEFDMLGLINARPISKGRYGRTREIKLAIPENILDKSRGILIESLDIV